MEPLKFDVVIVGGGLVGLAFAARLANSGLRLALVEKHTPQRQSGWDSRIYAFSPSNVQALQKLGTWSRVDPSRVASVQKMCIQGDQPQGQLAFSAYETGVESLAWIAESQQVLCALWEQIQQQANVTCFCPARSQSATWHDDYASLTLDNGLKLHAQLLIGCDGRHSWLREQAGIHIHATPYHQQGVVANFRCEKPHRGTAYQWFRPDGILAYLPLPEQHISMVWSAPDDFAAELVTLPPDTLAQRVATAGEYRLGALSSITPAAAFPLRLMQAEKMVAPRLALLGDAAHNVHPLAGQGVNLGFQDAWVLADILNQRQVGETVGDYTVLRRFERQRQEDIFAMAFVTDNLHRLFYRCDASPVAWLRNAGLALTNQLSPLKTLLIRQAIGV